jgi:hypothetical protein
LAGFAGFALLASRRLSSFSTACQTKLVRNSSSRSTASMRASVPAGKRAVMSSAQRRFLPTDALLKKLRLQDESGRRQRCRDFAVWQAYGRIRLRVGETGFQWHGGSSPSLGPPTSAGGRAGRGFRQCHSWSPGTVRRFTGQEVFLCHHQRGRRIISHMRFDISNMRYLTSMSYGGCRGSWGGFRDEARVTYRPG